MVGLAVAVLVGEAWGTLLGVVLAGLGWAVVEGDDVVVDDDSGELMGDDSCVGEGLAAVAPVVAGAVGLGSIAAVVSGVGEGFPPRIRPQIEMGGAEISTSTTTTTTAKGTRGRRRAQRGFSSGIRLNELIGLMWLLL